MKFNVLITLFLISGAAWSQLNSEAQLLKDNYASIYANIKILVAKDWEGDHKMMVYGINKQAEAFFEMSTYMDSVDYDERIMENAVSEWSETINDKMCTDFKMVVYTYKRQLQAKGSY